MISIFLTSIIDEDWFWILLMVIGFWMFAVAIYIMFKNKNKKQKRSGVRSHSGKKLISNRKICEFLPNFDRDRFAVNAFNTFVNCQEAANNADLDSLYRLLGAKLFNKYNQAITQNLNGGLKLIRNEFAHYYTDIIGIVKQNNEVYVNCLLGIGFKEYYVNANNEVVRGSMTVPVYKEFNVVFAVRNNNRAIISCPHCGALVATREISHCTYCQKPLVSFDYDLVMLRERSRRIRKPKVYTN